MYNIAMSIVLLFIVLIIVFFALSFFSRRRFGVLGLALATGVVLSDFWAMPLADFFERSGLSTGALTVPSVTAGLLIIAPAAILFTGGPSYNKLAMRIIGSLCFTLLLVALLIEPLGNSLVLTGENKQVYDWLSEHRYIVISIGFIFAIIDILLIHSCIFTS